MINYELFRTFSLIGLFAVVVGGVSIFYSCVILYTPEVLVKILMFYIHIPEILIEILMYITTFYLLTCNFAISLIGHLILPIIVIHSITMLDIIFPIHYYLIFYSIYLFVLTCSLKNKLIGMLTIACIQETINIMSNYDVKTIYYSIKIIIRDE